MNSTGSKQLKILFVLRSKATISYFSSAIHVLAGKGFYVTVFFDAKWSKKNRYSADEQLQALKSELANFDFASVSSRTDFWRPTFLISREVLSYRNYLFMENQSDYYRMDWIKFLPAKLRPFLYSKNSLANLFIRSNAVSFILRAIEFLVPADKKIVAEIRKLNPDVVVVSPVNFRHSSADLEYLKAAKKLKIPTALPVISWDNLTVRGLIHVVPDRLLAWNYAHKGEAKTYHGISEKTIRLTGSPLFDIWFPRPKPSMPRSEFFNRHNLPFDGSYVLYLGSSRNIAKNEVWLIKNLRKSLDESDDPRVRKTKIVVRPHPANYGIYEHLDGGGIVIVPKQGMLPSTEDSKRLFYDTLHYSIGTVSINTSGMLDAIIVDKPSATVVTKEYSQTQMETAHFRHLLENDVLDILRTPEAFADWIKQLIDGGDSRADKRIEFVKKFVRPCGLEKSAGEVAADEIENLASSR